jgi:glycosidase
MSGPVHPSLYQINTRAWLGELTSDAGRRLTLADVPDPVLDAIAELGADWVWLLGVWQTGSASRAVSRAQPEWRREFAEVLPDLTEDDICGSCFAVTGYEVHRDLGGEAALADLRRRLAERGLLLMLDFVPNHTALDHPWVNSHPEFFVAGREDDLVREPANFLRVDRKDGSLILAHGRDPYFPGWPDTLQLNYGEAAVRAAMGRDLLRIAERCDGVRCDMAMLVLPEVFKHTWGIEAADFWPEAIAAVRRAVPGFVFMAEVYWDLEWVLQQQGFDYTYDKRLYDRLRDGHAAAVRGHLVADLDFQRKLARFLENHDEPRAAAVFQPATHRAAAVVTFFAPGLRFFHEGQFEGRRKRLSPHLCRRPAEPVDEELLAFYRRLLSVLDHSVTRDGRWSSVTCHPAWDGNATWDQFIAYAWENGDGERRLVTVNYGPTPGQCLVPLTFGDLADRDVRLVDLMGDAAYDRDGNELMAPGLYLDLPAWGHHVFAVFATSRGDVP